ncbi:MAG: hypothetical protein JAY90_20155 [Candidatus Thiodiazotropha lotti]|nr:hypothetical protein [Candidatus Thiodiazotropha lotti]
MYYNPIRVFAAMTAHPVNPLNVGRSTAQPGIDQATAAAMCRKMPTLAFMAAMYKWAGDHEQHDFLMYRLIIAAADIASEEQWRLPKGKEYLRKMSEIALKEVIEPGRWKDGTRKAEYMGMDKSTFYKTWRKRYESIYQVLDGWAQDGYRYVQRKNIEL